MKLFDNLFCDTYLLLFDLLFISIHLLWNYSFFYIKLSLWPCIILILNIVAFATAPNHELSSSDRSLSITYVYTYLNYKIDSLATATSSASLESEFLSLCNSMLQWTIYYHLESKLLLLLYCLKITPSNFILKDNS